MFLLIYLLDLAYKTHKTVNRLVRESCGVRTSKGGINLNIELEKHKLYQIATRNIKMSVDQRIAISE